MTQQAQNSIALYKGQDANKIEALLNLQNESVVRELMLHFDSKTLEELASKLSWL